MQSNSLSTIANSQQMQNPILQAILLLAFTGLFGWFILAPKFTANDVTRTELAELKTQRQNLEADQVELNRLIAQMQTAQDDIRLVDEAVPLSSRPTKIAVLIEAYARNSALTLKQLNIDGLDEHISAGNKDLADNQFGGNRALATINVTANVSGNIEQFRNFLQLLEQSGRIIDVDSMIVSSDEEAIQFNIRLKTYAYELNTSL
ncbi:MAG TPA: hypothetical protein PKD79_01310 [Candidatus Doudnabacteria bacterium]|nr:hypothetical protein [Candidatus Doudnabacteria bacterium]